MSNITWKVLAARTQQDVEDRQCDLVDENVQTSKEARERAKYVLTDAYQRSAEMSGPLTYSQVVRVSGPSWDRKEEVVADFFRKDAK